MSQVIDPATVLHLVMRQHEQILQFEERLRAALLEIERLKAQANAGLSAVLAKGDE